MTGRIFKLLFLFCLFSFYAKATHNRAGEITYKRIEPFTKVQGGITVQVYTYSITVIKYTDDGPGIADRCVDTIYFGDGQRGIAPRQNGFASGCQCGFINGLAVTCGSIIINETGYRVKVNVYSIVHTYPGPGTYLIRTFDPNRNQGVHNIPNSVNIPFYIESMLIINAFTGANSSPLFAFPPVDRACLGICFEHNPGAYDPDGDSLSYQITTSRGVDGQTVPLYFYPETGSGGTFGIDAVTGLVRWCTPQLAAEYNIAFIVKEWRKNTSGNYQLIGYVLRDMQVIVKNCDINHPPSIDVPNLCVEAGKSITASLTVRDPDNGNIITVSAGGGAFSVPNSPASFNPSSGTTYTPASSFNVYFTWNTNCEHIRSQPYESTFKVEDNQPVKLVSFNTMSIKVIPPSVKNVTAVPAGTTMKISWTPSTCSPTSNPLTGYKIYRKPDCKPFVFDPCTGGVPSTSGFTLIGQKAPAESFIIDDNNGDGLVVGQEYSYIVVATYKDGTQSVGGTQVCAHLKRDVPVLLNVDVDSTSSTGIIWLRWGRPLMDPVNFDTSTIHGPYQFVLKQRTSSAAAFATLQTFTANSVLALDTQYTHKNVNTEVESQEYSIDFYAGDLLIGSSQKASSIFLKTIPSDRKVTLQWSSKTPWKNYNYIVMRQDSTSPNFVQVATTTLTTYSDTNRVINGSTYCYYITGYGQYSDTSIYRPLVNKSQRSCAKPVDMTPPATPTINMDADCPLARLTVRWTDIGSIPGSDDVYKYILYYKPTVSGTYAQISSALKNEPLEFTQDDTTSFAGCYAVKSIDIHGNESPLSPDFCIENCPIFELPNIFTPNGDGINDVYKAIRWRRIKEINLNIVDRWGNLVYTTKDPDFKWDGISIISKVKVSEGTFFYICDVYEPRLKGIVKRTLKGYVEVAR